MLDDLKVMLGLTGNDQDALLKLIVKQTEAALQFKMGTQSVPEELQWIELEVCISRFNRLKNEGMTSYSQEGESITFKTSDFDDFADDINEWRRQHQKDTKSLGHVAFINPYGGDSNASR